MDQKLRSLFEGVRVRMFRLSAARVLRLLIGVAVFYMLVTFAMRYIFDWGGGIDVNQKQRLVNYMATNMDVKYEVTNNLIEDHKFVGRITLTNKGSKTIPSGPWKIFFFHPVDIEFVRHDEIGTELANRRMFISHVNGGVFKLQPTAQFETIEPGQSLKIQFEGGRWISSKSDVYPNWYVHMRGASPAVITSTMGESLSFVGDFDKEPKWKRNTKDNYNPFTPEERYKRNEVEDLGRPGGLVVPTPLQVRVDKSRSVTVNGDSWVVVGSDLVQNEVAYLAAKTGLKEVHFKPKSKFISLQQSLVDLPGADVVKRDAYVLTVDADTESILIAGPNPSGVFYGVQSLLDMLETSKTIPTMRIVDAPRFAYRGFMLDVGRNFFPKERVMKLIDAMSMYKLNKLHLHLTEDEGWRLEVPGLPELTELGGRRCHDLHEQDCLLPYLGAGPHAGGLGSGYYTVRDYKDILTYAKKRHVEIIPEVDLPGHAHAAIKAMLLRYGNLKHEGKGTEAEQFLLNDLDDQSRYHSVQQFKDNVINVCMESTYAFVEAVMTSLVEAHKDIAPLQTLHIGGDEVPGDALMKSPKCKAFMEQHGFTSQANLTKYFSERILKIASKFKVNIQGWEDVFYQGRQLKKFDGRSNFTANVWSNIWTGPNVHRSYNLANNGYKVVLGTATHLYLDHPYEPDPEERGLFWATRYVDTYKVFGFLPESFYDNIDVSGNGHPLTKEEVCGVDVNACPKLTHPKNIVGLEAHLWSETVRTEEHLHTMVFPRLIAMAERSWHRANWELEMDTNRRQRMKNIDWNEFANTIGYRELPRLEKRGIKYHIPVPGAVIKDGTLKMNAAIPGLPFVVSTDGGNTWVKLATDYHVSGTVLLATSSHDGKRRSRGIKMTVR